MRESSRGRLAFLGEATGDEVRDDFLDVGVGLEELVVGVDIVGAIFGCFEELVERGVIFIHDEIGLSDNGGAILEIDKAVWTLEVEGDFLRVEEVKHRDIVLPKAQVLEGRCEFIGFDEEVRKNDHERSLLDFFSHGVERFN